MISDPIGDLLARIKNAQYRRKESIKLPTSNMINSIVELLKVNGFITDYRIEKSDVQNEIEVFLKYINKEPAITQLKRVSKPGIRKYKGYRDIKPVKSGLGIAIYSTPKGVMTGEQAIDGKVGGEILCEIY